MNFLLQTISCDSKTQNILCKDQQEIMTKYFSRYQIRIFGHHVPLKINEDEILIICKDTVYGNTGYYHSIYNDEIKKDLQEMFSIGKIKGYNEYGAIFELGESEQGMVYKNSWAYYNRDDEVCYIPENQDTEYTFKDFLALNEIEEIVNDVFEGVDWQHPETYHFELLDDDEYMADMERKYGKKEKKTMERSER